MEMSGNIFGTMDTGEKKYSVEEYSQKIRK